MGLRTYLSLKKARIRSKIERLVNKILKNENRHEDNLNSSESKKKHSIINLMPKTPTPIPRQNQGESLGGSFKSNKETEMSPPIDSIPEGSRVLSISLMKGEIMEKVYLTPDGKKISFKGKDL